MNKEKSLSVGDTIKCYDKEDLLNTHNALAKSGITTESEYELNGEKGYWLVVEKIEQTERVLDHGA